MTSSIQSASRLIQRTHVVRPTQTFYKGRLYTKEPPKHVKIEFRGEFYEGEIKDGLPHGFGTRVSPRGKEEGQWVKGKFTGRGTVTYTDGTMITGFFRNSILEE